MKNDMLQVYLYGEYMGLLERDLKGRIHFSYDRKHQIPLSLSLPLSKSDPTTPIDRHQCAPYFSGLIPENPEILNPLSVGIKTHASDIFGVLHRLGFDCAGAVQFKSEFSSTDLVITSEDSKSLLTAKDIEIEKFIKTLPKNPFFLSALQNPALLSGKQPKVGIQYVNHQIQLCFKPHLSTHILKPALGQTDVIQNEWFCMTLAQKIGLPTAHVALKHFGKVLGLVIERYDRFVQNDSIKMLHQEDFCQALGVFPYRKFQRNKGVCIKDCFDLLSKTAIPARARIQLMDAIIFNYLINNTNAHAKKFSLLIDEIGVISLAPLYGLQCGYTTNQCSKTAMKLGGQYEMSAVKSDDWHILCKEVGYSYPALRKRVQELAERIMIVLPQIHWISQDANLDDDLIGKLESSIAQQCEQAIKLFYYE